MSAGGAAQGGKRRIRREPRGRFGGSGSSRNALPRGIVRIRASRSGAGAGSARIEVEPDPLRGHDRRDLVRAVPEDILEGKSYAIRREADEPKIDRELFEEPERFFR